MVDTVATPAATALGTVGTVLWCIQLIPQIIRNYIAKDGTGVPAAMMFLWAASGVPFGIYFILQRSNLAIQIQPQLFTFFCLISYGQILHYPPVGYSKRKATTIVLIQAILSAGIELAVILPLRPVYDRGTTWPALIFGVIAAVLLAAGLLPPYFELWKRKGRVVGINFIFLTLDSLGALFSLLSLVMQKGKLDILGLVLYCIVGALELGIFCSHAVWKIRTVYFGLPIQTEVDPEPAITIAETQYTQYTSDKVDISSAERGAEKRPSISELQASDV